MLSTVNVSGWQLTSCVFCIVVGLVPIVIAAMDFRDYREFWHDGVNLPRPSVLSPQFLLPMYYGLALAIGGSYVSIQFGALPAFVSVVSSTLGPAIVSFGNLVVQTSGGPHGADTRLIQAIGLIVLIGGNVLAYVVLI